MSILIALLSVFSFLGPDNFIFKESLQGKIAQIEACAGSGCVER